MKAEVTTWTGGDKERPLALAATQNTKSHMQTVGVAIVGHVRTRAQQTYVCHTPSGHRCLGVSVLERQQHKDTPHGETKTKGRQNQSADAMLQHNTQRRQTQKWPKYAEKNFTKIWLK